MGEWLLDQVSVDRIREHIRSLEGVLNVSFTAEVCRAVMGVVVDAVTQKEAQEPCKLN